MINTILKYKCLFTFKNGGDIMKEDKWWDKLSNKTKKKVMNLWTKQLPPLTQKDLPKPQ